MHVDEWFDDFVMRHTGRHHRSDWHTVAPDFWEMHRKSFIRNEVAEAVAEVASELMGDSEFPYYSNHLSAFLACVRAVWKSSEVAVPAKTREEAEKQSKSCPDCQGLGFASRFLHEPHRPAAVLHYCLCPMGRWIEKAHREGTEEGRRVRARTPDLADHPARQLGPVPWSDVPDNRHCYRESAWDFEANQPRALPVPPRPLAMHRMLKRAGDVPAF